VIFETERLVAREWTLDDTEAAYGIYRDPEVVRFLGSVPVPVESVDAMRARVERWIAGNDALRGTGYGFWALATHDGTLVGATLLKPLPDAEESRSAGTSAPRTGVAATRPRARAARWRTGSPRSGLTSSTRSSCRRTRPRSRSRDGSA
jgi:hypothetical protein